MTAEKPGPRTIKVIITPRGEGRINVHNEGPFSQPVALPDNMTGPEALMRARKLHECTVGYDLQVEDLTRAN